ncbi:hypothetical protein L195_g022688, partial [Trifolium pratense]
SKVNINKNLAAPPKPKPPDPSELLLSKSKPPDPLSLELRQSKSWDFDQLATTLPRREPQPKPPDLSKSVDREREREMRGGVAEGVKMLEEKRVKRTFGELSESLNLMS